jgi:hypothetical protein
LELETRVFFENGLGNLESISHFTDLRQARGAKKVPNIILKTKLNTEEIKYTKYKS